MGWFLVIFAAVIIAFVGIAAFRNKPSRSTSTLDLQAQEKRKDGKVK